MDTEVVRIDNWSEIEAWCKTLRMLSPLKRTAFAYIVCHQPTFGQQRMEDFLFHLVPLRNESSNASNRYQSWKNVFSPPPTCHVRAAIALFYRHFFSARTVDQEASCNGYIYIYTRKEYTQCVHLDFSPSLSSSSSSGHSRKREKNERILCANSWLVCLPACLSDRPFGSVVLSLSSLSLVYARPCGQSERHREGEREKNEEEKCWPVCFCPSASLPIQMSCYF